MYAAPSSSGFSKPVPKSFMKHKVLAISMTPSKMMNLGQDLSPAPSKAQARAVLNKVWDFEIVDGQGRGRRRLWGLP